jgi:membrane carboxypeptidase/penicillin-binding protein
MAMNSAAQSAVARGAATLEKRYKLSEKERLEGALASVDQTTGFVRALVGGRSYAQSTFNRILNMKRQVGSTFKPFVYLAAFQKGLDPAGVPYGPGHPAEDAPWKLSFDHGRQEWAPKNYEKEHLGWIDLRAALAHSINTVAAKLGYEIGTERIIKTARALGIESELPAVPSLALGVAELSPVELLKAYAVLANHGTQDELTVIRAITQDDGSAYARFVYHPREVFEPGPVDLLTDCLQTVFTDGTAKVATSLGFERPAAGKTGTTSNHRDAWFADYTPQLTTVVWIDLDHDATPETDKEPSKPTKPKPIRINLTGATAALPIWIDFMKEALAGEAPTPFPISPHLTDVTIDRHTGQKASLLCSTSQTVTEKYLRDAEPKDTSCVPGWPDSVRETKGE